MNSENSKEAEALALLHVTLLQKIDEARKKGDITTKRAQELKAWGNSGGQYTNFFSIVRSQEVLPSSRRYTFLFPGGSAPSVFESSLSTSLL